MISFDEAIEAVRCVGTPLGTERVRLDEAAARVLAAPVTACIDSPRADVSAMDGYAVRDADLAPCPVALRVAGESFAGAGWSGEVEPGTCVRIFTGAPVPKGADRVIIQENVVRDGDLVRIADHPGPAHHIRKRGGDFRTGDTLLLQGRLLDPRGIVAAAGADVADVEVFRQPIVTILSTGDELAEPGSAGARPDAVPESVSFGVAAMVRQWGGIVRARHRLPDVMEVMTKTAAEACQGSDLIVVTGGASVGEKDFAKAMFEGQGLKLIFSKVAIKPGKPVWLGRAGSALVIGLPGNPTSALVTARLLLAPLLCGMTGRAILDALRWRVAPLAADLEPCGVRETFHRARWSDGRAEILSNQDSSAQHALAAADLLVRQLAHSPAQKGDSSAEVIDF